MPKGDGHTSKWLTHFRLLQAFSLKLRVLRFPVACISVSKKIEDTWLIFPFLICFLFTCRSLRFSFVFDNLFCGYEVRHKQNVRWRNLGWNETPVEVLPIFSDGDHRKTFWVWNFRCRDSFGVGKFGRYFFSLLDLNWRILVVRTTV